MIMAMEKRSLSHFNFVDNVDDDDDNIMMKVERWILVITQRSL